MRKPARRGVFLALLLALLLPQAAAAAASSVFTSREDNVRLVSQGNAPAAARKLALEFVLQPGWHIYWRNPGDAGLAPAVSLAPPAQAGALEFPPPELLQQGPITDYVLSGHVVIPFTATGAGKTLTAEATWLVCADVCVPQRADFTLAFTGGPSAEAGLFGPPPVVASPFAAQLAPDGALSVFGPTATQVKAARFFPYIAGSLANGAPQNLTFFPGGLRLQLRLAQPAPAGLAGVLELTDPSGATQALAVDARAGPAPASPPYPLLAVLAFLGGILLNFMPCVFPVLAMKALALARLGGAAGHKIRAEAAGYSLGVMAAMLALAGLLLALRGLGVAAGWGFQFQSPVFVALTAFLILGATLSLAGAAEFSAPASLGRLGPKSSFATGVLAVVLATPCTAPFMGGAVAAALTAPVLVALAIFASLGLGLALPFLLLAAAPGMARILPKPGAWMLWLQRFLALPMAATFCWLAWVLKQQAGFPGLALLLLASAALIAGLAAPKLRPLALCALLVLPFLHAGPSPPLSLPGAQAYTPARLNALRAANRPVFIDLTAAWCVTCLVNEATTLTTPAVRSAFAAHHVALLVGDWTDKNPDITALLAANGRAGVPLYLYYPPGAAPVLLPQILEPGTVVAVLKR